jgi:hypothetical protein
MVNALAPNLLNAARFWDSSFIAAEERKYTQNVPFVIFKNV